MEAHLEDVGDFEPGWDRQEEEERPGTSELLEEQPDELLGEKGRRQSLNKDVKSNRSVHV